jgi:hypothetical protein
VISVVSEAGAFFGGAVSSGFGALLHAAAMDRSITDANRPASTFFMFFPPRKNFNMIPAIRRSSGLSLD